MNKEDININDLYPELTKEELEEAERNLKRYAELILRMYSRIASNLSAIIELEQLTESEPVDSIQEGSDNSQQ